MIAAQQFVLALRAGFDLGQAARNGEIDRLIIAGLEMQEGHIFDRSPSCGRTGCLRRTG